MSQNPSGLETWSNSQHWLTVAYNPEVIRSYKGSAQPLFSLLPLSYDLLHSFLYHSQGPPNCWNAADCLRQPANKSSCAALPHCSNAWACRQLTKIPQDTTSHQTQVLKAKPLSNRATRVAGSELLQATSNDQAVYSCQCVPPGPHCMESQLFPAWLPHQDP